MSGYDRCRHRQNNCIDSFSLILLMAEEIYKKMLIANICTLENESLLTETEIEKLLDWNNFSTQKIHIQNIISQYTENNIDENIECISKYLINLCHSYNLNIYSDYNDKITIIINAVLTECDKRLCKMENNKILSFPAMLPFIDIFTDYTMKIILLKVVSLKAKILMSTIIVKNCLYEKNCLYNSIQSTMNKTSYSSVIEHLMDRSDISFEDADYNMWNTLKYLFFVYILFHYSSWLSHTPLIQWENCWNEVLFWKCLNFIDELINHKILRFRCQYEKYQSSMLSLRKLKNLITFTSESYPSVKCDNDGPIFLFLAQAFTCRNLLENTYFLGDKTVANTRNSSKHYTSTPSFINPSDYNNPNNNLCDKIFWINYNQYPDIVSLLLNYGFVVLSNMTTENELYSLELILKLLKYITMNRRSCQLIHEYISDSIVVYRAIKNSQKGLLNDNIIKPNYLVYYVIELVKSFIGGYLRRKIPLYLFSECLLILKNCFLYQVQTHTRRHNTNYVMLWTLLFSLLNFVCSKTIFVDNVEKDDISMAMDVVIDIVDIFDLFIVCGDDLLEGPGSYDRLYYEIIRNQELLLELSNRLIDLNNNYFLTKTSLCELRYNDLARSVNNFKAIIQHFIPIISETCTTKKLGCVDESELLDLIVNNYGDLNLHVSAKIHAPLETIPTIEFTRNQIDTLTLNTRTHIDNIQIIIESANIEK